MEIDYTIGIGMNAVLKLGEGHPDTWRLMLIKAAARIVVTARRVRILLSGSWPFLDFYRQVSDAVLAVAAGSTPDTS